MSVLVDIADAVVAGLNGGAFSLPFTAARLYSPEFTLDELKTLRVSVAPKAEENEPATRESDLFSYAVDVAIQQCVTGDDEAIAAALDALMTLREEIVDWLRSSDLPGLTDVTEQRVANDPVYVPDVLRSRREFLSVITVTYRMRR